MSVTNDLKTTGCFDEECTVGLNEFFDQHSLDECRVMLWQWLNVSASGQFHQLCYDDRDRLMQFYTHLQRLMETVHHFKLVQDSQDGTKPAMRPAKVQQPSVR